MNDSMVLNIRLRQDPTDELMEEILGRLHTRFPDAIDGWVWEEAGEKTVRVMLFGRFTKDETHPETLDAQ